MGEGRGWTPKKTNISGVGYTHHLSDPACISLLLSLAPFRGGIPCWIAELKCVSFRLIVVDPNQYIPHVTVRIFIIVSSRSLVTTADALNDSEPWHMFHCRVNSSLCRPHYTILICVACFIAKHSTLLSNSPDKALSLSSSLSLCVCVCVCVCMHELTEWRMGAMNWMDGEWDLWIEWMVNVSSEMNGTNLLLELNWS